MRTDRKDYVVGGLIFRLPGRERVVLRAADYGGKRAAFRYVSAG